MEDRQGMFVALSHFIHRRFLWLLVASYVAAAACPAPGLWLRQASLGRVALLGERVDWTLPLVLLAFLLWNAGLGVRADRLRGLLRGPHVLAAGLAANVLLPLAFLLLLTRALCLWHNPEEVQQLLVGLALVAAMPVAGSSAAWAQKADGDLSLSLGLVLGSTLLSPLTTPAALHAAGLMAHGVYAEALHDLAASGTGAFLVVGVVLPSLLGLLTRWAAGAARAEAAQARLRPAGSLALLALCYANAAVSLPQAVAESDWDFLAMLTAAAVGLCVLSFAAGWALARLLRADAAQRTALMYGLGMNNNGTGLVLAGTALAGRPRVLLPVILYNLVQHLVAGTVGTMNRTPAAPAERPAAGGRAA